jgi:hypothetical protein
MLREKGENQEKKKVEKKECSAGSILIIKVQSWC